MNELQPYRPFELRQDEVDWFERISDGKTVLWLSGATTYLYHATVDGLVALCSPKVPVDRERDMYPDTTDRSCNLMTCDRCAALVRRIPMKHPNWRELDRMLAGVKKSQRLSKFPPWVRAKL